MPTDADLIAWLTALRARLVNVSAQLSTVKMRQGLTAALAVVDAELALLKPAKPALPPTLTVAVVGTSATLTIVTPPGPVTGVNVFTDGTGNANKTSTGYLNNGATVTSPVTITRTQILTSGSRVLYANVYNDAGEGPLTLGVPVTVTPPMPVQVSREGLFAWDQTFATTLSLLAKFGLSTPTAGRPLICPLHLDRRSDWATATRIWFAADWAASGPAYRKAVTVPGWPDGVAGSLAAVARGDYDANYRTIVTGVVAAFPGEVHEYRFMHEANCCYNHAAVNDPTSYKAGFDRFYGIAHTLDPTCVVVFCPIFGDGNIFIEQIEPPRLDKYAMDYYASAFDYQHFVTASHGLNFLAARGAVLGVPIGLYEFGPGEWGAPYTAQTMPDAPQWVTDLRTFQQAHPIDIVNYIDDTRSEEGVRSDFTAQPNCLKAWVASSTTKV